MSIFIFLSHIQIFTRLDCFTWKLKNQDKLFFNRTKNFLKHQCISHKLNEQDCDCARIFQNFVST